jgi:hypothetical protein
MLRHITEFEPSFLRDANLKAPIEICVSAAAGKLFRAFFGQSKEATVFH